MTGFMSAGIHGTGRIYWDASSDDEGNRTYTIRHRVRTLKDDGPLIARNTPGLPLIGSFWNYGNEADIFATRMPGSRVTEDTTDVNPSNVGGVDYKYWIIEDRFSTRPITRCQDTPIDDPLQEPDRVSGSFSRFTKEARFDIDGDAIKSSSHELVHGSEVEIDDNRPLVVIEQNRPLLELSLISSMINTVNATPLWGLPSRTIKLSNAPWSRKVFGSCTYYYTRRLEFEINYNTWDNGDPVDEGTKVLQGKWTGNQSSERQWTLLQIDGTDPDPANPTHFMRAIDVNHKPIHVLLDGLGKPLIDGDETSSIPLVNDKGALKLYPESNFLLLGVPLTF